ncbi:MAG TPA: hypothetical protein VFD13_05050 [Candidatus Kapabacteria bacterium]|nr:hypothetical protein [Candidatus Kapabacteria bacterium]
MKRSYLYSAVVAAIFAGSFAMSGCKAPTVAYQTQQFASLRVMNFAQNCTAPMDVYWGLTPPTRLGNNAQIYNLPYGSSSVYSNSLFAASNGTPYHIVATPTRIPHEIDDSLTTVLMPDSSYTLFLTVDPNNPSLFKYLVFSDQVKPIVPPAITKPAFARFINLRSGVGPLSVHVNDPVTGDLVTPAGGENFFNISPYVALNTATDTSFAFIVTNVNNQVLARLSYQTFVAGGYFTLVYGGDPCNTIATNPADTSISSLDTFRLHAFDDNSTGNDVTNPIQYTYRYNIINDVYPAVPYDPNNPQNNAIGYLVNGGGFPEHAGYSINPIPALKPGGAGATPLNSDSSLYDVNYQSSILANPLDIKGFSTNATGSVQKQVFDYSLQGPFSTIPQDKPVTFLFGGVDTVPKNSVSGYWGAGTTPTTKILSVPDVNYSDSVTFVLISGINPSSGVGNTSTGSYTYFWIQSPDGAVSQPSGNSSGFSFGREITMRFPLSTISNFVITDSIGTGTNRVPGTSFNLTAEPGGIYEVASMGIKADRRLLIMQVNKNP